MSQQQSESEKQAEDSQIKARDEVSRICRETIEHAYEAYKEAKKQADTVYNEAKKIAVDKQAKNEADKAHKEALQQAEKLRDAIVVEASAVSRRSWDQATADRIETTTKSLQAIKDADEAHKEARKQADIVYNEAKKIAVDKQAKNEADKAHKEALEQAKRVWDEAKRKLR